MLTLSKAYCSFNAFFVFHKPRLTVLLMLLLFFINLFYIHLSWQIQQTTDFFLFSQEQDLTFADHLSSNPVSVRSGQVAVSTPDLGSRGPGFKSCLMRNSAHDCTACHSTEPFIITSVFLV